MIPTHAMVLAAGFGKRLKPLTDTMPKPLIPVAGRCMLDRTLDRLEEAGVQNLVVNAHYLADRIALHLKERPDIVLLYEDEILETGGGVAHALPYLGNDPFFVANSDIIWMDGPEDPALCRLAAAWDDSSMDALLLLHPVSEACGYEEEGNFFFPPLRWRQDGKTAPYVFAGVQILHPRLFSNAPKGAFSLRELYHQAFDRGRLSAVIHDGRWYHVGTPSALAETTRRLKNNT